MTEEPVALPTTRPEAIVAHKKLRVPRRHNPETALKPFLQHFKPIIHKHLNTLPFSSSIGILT